MCDNDTVCFFCLLADCDEADPRCLYRNLRRVRDWERRVARTLGGDWVALAYLARLAGNRPRVLYRRAVRGGLELRRAGCLWCVRSSEAGRLLGA
jgi:hypothetical protein